MFFIYFCLSTWCSTLCSFFIVTVKSLLVCQLTNFKIWYDPTRFHTPRGCNTQFLVKLILTRFLISLFSLCLSFGHHSMVWFFIVYFWRYWQIVTFIKDNGQSYTFQSWISCDEFKLKLRERVCVSVNEGRNECVTSAYFRLIFSEIVWSPPYLHSMCCCWNIRLFQLQSRSWRKMEE